MPIQIISIILATAALVMSGLTLWLTLLRNGELKMTKPAIAYFGYDRTPLTAKVYVRALLYSTAKRAQVIESMFALVEQTGKEPMRFAFWGYGPSTELSPGSGLLVPDTGFAANHHFVVPVHLSNYRFTGGEHTVRIFARQAGKEHPTELCNLAINVTHAHASELDRGGGVLFTLDPQTGHYAGESSRQPTGSPRLL